MSRGIMFVMLIVHEQGCSRIESLIFTESDINAYDVANKDEGKSSRSSPAELDINIFYGSI